MPDLVPVLEEYQFAPKRHTLLKPYGPHHSTRWYAASQSHAAGLTDFRQSQRSSKDSDDDTYSDEDDADDVNSDEDEYFDDDDEGADFDDVSGSLAQRSRSTQVVLSPGVDRDLLSARTIDSLHLVFMFLLSQIVFADAEVLWWSTFTCFSGSVSRKINLTRRMEPRKAFQGQRSNRQSARLGKTCHGCRQWVSKNSGQRGTMSLIRM